MLKSLATLALLAATISPTLAADAPPPLKVAKFLGDRPAAISYTFDDGLRDHYTIALPMLDEFKLRGTFFIIGKVVCETPEEVAAKKPGAHGTITWNQIKEIADKGHEIGSHSWSHRQMTKLEEAELQQEIQQNTDILKQKLGYAPLTFCYPGNGKNDHVREVVLQSHFASRDFQFEIGQATQTTADINAWADKNVNEGTWGVAMIHAISEGYHALSSPDVLRQHFAYVKERDSTIWVDTFANVSRYIAERDAAQIKVLEQGPKKLRFTLETPLKQPPYDVPLTVIAQVGATKKATATQGKQKLETQIRNDQILVTATPSKDPIELTWQ